MPSEFIRMMIDSTQNIFKFYKSALKYIKVNLADLSADAYKSYFEVLTNKNASYEEKKKHMINVLAEMLEDKIIDEDEIRQLVEMTKLPTRFEKLNQVWLRFKTYALKIGATVGLLLFVASTVLDILVSLGII